MIPLESLSSYIKTLQCLIQIFLNFFGFFFLEFPPAIYSGISMDVPEETFPGSIYRDSSSDSCIIAPGYSAEISTEFLLQQILRFFFQNCFQDNLRILLRIYSEISSVPISQEILLRLFEQEKKNPRRNS